MFTIIYMSKTLSLLFMHFIKNKRLKYFKIVFIFFKIMIFASEYQDQENGNGL